jgi:hypothetical protein
MSSARADGVIAIMIAKAPKAAIFIGLGWLP